MAIRRFSLFLLLTTVHYYKVRADTVNLQENLNCTGNGINSVLFVTLALPLTVPISSIFQALVEYRTFSRIACAFMCNDYRDCAAITYDEANQICELYYRNSPMSVSQTLADPTSKYCWKTKIFDTPSLFLTSPSTISTTSTANYPTIESTDLSSCSSGASLSAYTRPTSVSCPSLTYCTCGKNLNVGHFTGFTNANDCFTNCSSNSNCLAFAYYPGACYIATTTSHLTLQHGPNAFTCYCNKSAAVTTKAVIIKNVTYPNLSCHPQKLFPESSYPKIRIGAYGREADCKCEGGLYIQDGTYVNSSAFTFADCFSACENISSPPCKAFAFMEANNTCIIAPTNGNGDSTNKGVLQCYT